MSDDVTRLAEELYTAYHESKCTNYPGWGYQSLSGEQAHWLKVASLALTTQPTPAADDTTDDVTRLAEPNPAYEATAAKFRAATRTGDGEPEGTAESLGRCATMLDTYAPDLYPANEKGQVHFARAMMESVADEIRAYLAARPTPAADDAMVAGLRELTERVQYRKGPVGLYVSCDDCDKLAALLTATADRLAGLAGEPVTTAGTDFRTWKRENLERLAVELTARVIELEAVRRP
jgi:hypothetical protein